MRIVHYLARMRLEDGGVVRAVLDLCAALAERGHDVTVLSFDVSDAPGSWDGGAGRPGTATLPGAPGLAAALGPATTAAASAALADADVVHLHVPWDPVCARLGAAARRRGVPYVVGIHGMLDDWSMEQKALKKRLYLALVGRRFLERAAAVLNTAEAERDQSSRWYPGGNGVVLPLIFDLTDYESLPGAALIRDDPAMAEHFPPDGVPVVLFLSRLHPKKRVEALIDAAALLRDQGRAFKLLIAGTGEATYEQGLRSQVERLDLSSHIAFLGFVAGRAKVSLYEAAAVSALPTSQENWGFALIESLACGTPAVTTKGVDIWSELQDSGGAVICPGDPPAVAAAIGELLADSRRCREMGEQGRRWVLENLNTDHVVERYEALYGKVKARRHEGA